MATGHGALGLLDPNCTDSANAGQALHQQTTATHLFLMLFLLQDYWCQGVTTTFQAKTTCITT
jgi:hypothetical protein